MKKLIASIITASSILFGFSSFAGTGFYVTIHNGYIDPVNITSCHNDKDWNQDISTATLNSGKTETYYLESFNDAGTELYPVEYSEFTIAGQNGSASTFCLYEYNTTIPCALSDVLDVIGSSSYVEDAQSDCPIHFSFGILSIHEGLQTSISFKGSTEGYYDTGYATINIGPQ